MENKEVETLLISDEKELEVVAKSLLKYAGSKRKFLLEGPVGAGKTSLVKRVCKLLGVQGEVTSPTYGIINEYSIDGSSNTVNHIDLYRLNDLEEALEIGIEDYLYDDNYCFIEWPGIIGPILPEEAIKVDIKIIRNYNRKILFL